MTNAVDVAHARQLLRDTLAAAQAAAREHGAAMAATSVDEATAWDAVAALYVPSLSPTVLADAGTIIGEPRLPELATACEATIAAATTQHDSLSDALLDADELTEIEARRAQLDGRLAEARRRLSEARSRHVAAIVSEVSTSIAALEAEATRLSSAVARHHRARRELARLDDERLAIAERFLIDARRVVIDRLRVAGATSNDAVVREHLQRIEAAAARRIVVDVLFDSWVRPWGSDLIELEREARDVSGFELVSFPAKVRVRCADANAAIDAFRRTTRHAMTTALPVVVDDWWQQLVPDVPRPAPETFAGRPEQLVGITAPPRMALDVSPSSSFDIAADRASDKLAAAWASLNDDADAFAADSGLFYGLEQSNTDLFKLPKAPSPLTASSATPADDRNEFDEDTAVAPVVFAGSPGPVSFPATSGFGDIFTASRPARVVAERPVDLTGLTRPTFAAGERVGHCVIEGLIGKGGMGEVYRARLEGSYGFARKVVVKRLSLDRDEPTALQAFVREAETVARINHPNVVQIFDLQSVVDEPFMIMELLEGLSLHKLAHRAWREGLTLPPAIVARCAVDVARGLHAAHGLRRDDGGLVGLVHRDISPDNLFLCRSGHTKLLDFGIARRSDLTTMTGKTELKGKIPYMSPEQILGEHLDARSDLFSLGASLYWLLTGERPFVGDNEITTLYAVVNKPHVPLNARLADSGGLGDLVERLLRKGRDERPASALEVLTALEATTPATPEATAAWLATIEDR